MVNEVLRVEALTKRFGAVTANDEISLEVHPGQVVGLLGHNGAGKTTLVSQITGILRPDSGEVRVAGVDAVANPSTARRCVGIQAQDQAPIDGLTPAKVIELSARLRGVSRSRAKERALELAEGLDIGEWFEQRALPGGGGLSGGVRRLVSFAMAVAAPVPLIVADEPTNDVDAARRRLLWKMMRTLADKGAGVLLVTHNVLEAEKVVDHLVILDHGRVVATGTPGQLTGANKQSLRLELSLGSAEADPSSAGADPSEEASSHFPISRTVRAGRRILLTIDASHAQQAVAWASHLQAGGRIEEYSLTSTSLEDAYLAITASTEN